MGRCRVWILTSAQDAAVGDCDLWPPCRWWCWWGSYKAQASHYFLCKPLRKKRFGWLNSIIVTLTQCGPLFVCLHACLHTCATKGLCCVCVCCLSGFILCFSSVVLTQAWWRHKQVDWAGWTDPGFRKNGVVALWATRWSINWEKTKTRGKGFVCTDAGQDKDTHTETVMLLQGMLCYFGLLFIS